MEPFFIDNKLVDQEGVILFYKYCFVTCSLKILADRIVVVEPFKSLRVLSIAA